MTNPLIKRVEEIYAFYNNNICPGQITDIFVSEYIDSNGTREYESLGFFSDSLVMEAKQFVHEDSFYVAVVRHQITHIEIREQGYNFVRASDRSRSSVT